MVMSNDWYYCVWCEDNHHICDTCPYMEDNLNSLVDIEDFNLS